MNRRAWLRTAGGILAAPAVVRAESIMRVVPVGDPYAAITREALRILERGMVYDLFTDSYAPLPPGWTKNGRFVVRTGLPRGGQWLF